MLADLFIVLAVCAGPGSGIAPCVAPDGSWNLRTDPDQISGTAKRADEPTVSGFVWAQHPSLRFKNVRIDFEVKLQEDFQGSYEGADVSAGLSTFEPQRNRIGVQGKLFDHVEFEIERELKEKALTDAEIAEGMTPKPAWKDVNVNLDYFQAAQVQAGRFKIPFGLDELTGITHNDFAYRSLGAEYLAPGRDTGVALHGRLFKRAITYAAGVFLHDGDNARSKKIQGGNTTFALRATTKPFRRLAVEPLQGVEIGSALSVSALSDDWFLPNGLRGRTVMTEDAFFSAVYVKGQRRRWEADLDWPFGPAGVRGEFTRVTDERIGQGYDNQTLPPARYRSWYVTGTYLVTGEEKKRPVAPRRPFLQGGPGAIEIAVRIERLWCDSIGSQDLPFRNPRAENILVSGDRAVTIGVNWTLNRWVMLQLNAIREEIQDPERNPSPGRAAFWSRVLRLQLGL